MDRPVKKDGVRGKAMAEAHPFAPIVRTLARGPKLSRPLTRDEAQGAMDMILGDRVRPEQLGAMLAILRYRKETPEELAGFVLAARARIAAPAMAIDLDWPSFADRHRQLPWFVLAALLLAENGVRILMHGLAGAQNGFVPTSAALKALGIAPVSSLDAAAGAIERDSFAYILLDDYCPELARLFALRPILGVRTAVNTFARMLNPLGAPHLIQGVFHPAYRRPHVDASLLLGQPHLAVFKGGGGEAQRSPEKPCRVSTIDDGIASETRWPALLPGARFAWRDEPRDPTRLAALWRGALEAPAQEAAVIGTAAIALALLGRADSPEDADAQARAMWAARRRDRFGGT